MGSLYIDFGEVEGSFEAMPEGKYPIIIDRVEVRESKSSDYPYLNWELVIEDDDEFEGRRLWMITSLSPRALFRLKDVLLALDVIEDDEEMDLEWDDSVEVTPQTGPRLLFPEVEGLAAIATVQNEMYEGRERNRVEVLTLDDGSGTSSRKAKRKAKRHDEDEAPSRRRRRNKRDEEDEAPRRKSRSRARDEDYDDDDYDDEPDDDDEDYDDEEGERPRRRRQKAARSSRDNGRSSRRSGGRSRRALR